MPLLLHSVTYRLPSHTAEPNHTSYRRCDRYHFAGNGQCTCSTLAESMLILRAQNPHPICRQVSYLAMILVLYQCVLFVYLDILTKLPHKGCLIMPDFQRRFGEVDADGVPFLSSSRQSIITSLLSAGYVSTATVSIPSHKNSQHIRGCTRTGVYIG